MTIGERISKERKLLLLTQEDLAEKIGVSRQAISKWEIGSALPDIDNLGKLSLIFGVSLDYLVKGEGEEGNGNKLDLKEVFQTKLKEKHSQKTLWGLPLWSIGIKAKGFFALGFKSEGVFSLGFASRGIFSLGCFSLGCLSIGMASLGLLSLGAFSLGLLSCGAISLALLASCGAISIDPLSLGSLSLGDISIGALSRGKWFSYGDNAKAFVAVAKSKAMGDYTALLPVEKGKAEHLYLIVKENLPFYLKWTLGAVKSVLGL